MRPCCRCGPSHLPAAPLRVARAHAACWQPFLRRPDPDAVPHQALPRDLAPGGSAGSRGLCLWSSPASESCRLPPLPCWWGAGRGGPGLGPGLRHGEPFEGSGSTEGLSELPFGSLPPPQILSLKKSEVIEHETQSLGAMLPVALSELRGEMLVLASGPGRRPTGRRVCRLCAPGLCPSRLEEPRVHAWTRLEMAQPSA